MSTKWRMHLAALVTVVAGSLTGCYAPTTYTVVPPQSLLEEMLPADTYAPQDVPSPGTYRGTGGRGGPSR